MLATIIATLGLVGSACKSDAQKAAKEVDNAIGKAAAQAGEVRAAEGDVARARETVANRQAELSAAKSELAARAGDVVMARGEYLAQLTIRVADLDTRIAAADATRVDSVRVAALRKELAERVSAATAAADPAWTGAREDLERTWQALETSLIPR